MALSLAPWAQSSSSHFPLSPGSGLINGVTTAVAATAETVATAKDSTVALSSGVVDSLGAKLSDVISNESNCAAI